MTKGRPLNDKERKEWEKAFQDIEDSIKGLKNGTSRKIKTNSKEHKKSVS